MRFVDTTDAHYPLPTLRRMVRVRPHAVKFGDVSINLNNGSFDRSNRHQDKSDEGLLTADHWWPKAQALLRMHSGTGSTSASSTGETQCTLQRPGLIVTHKSSIRRKQVALKSKAYT